MDTKEIARLAKSKKICKDWHKRILESQDVESLCAMYFEGDDWAMENNFPSTETLKEYKGQTEEYGLHLDSNENFKNKKDLAFFGDSDVSISYDGFSVSKVIVRHGSKAVIKASDNAIVFVNILDDAFVNIETIGNAKVSVYRYSDNANYIITGRVSVKESNFDKK